MKRFILSLILIAALAGIAMAGMSMRQQQQASERLAHAEQTLAEQRETINSFAESKQRDNRWFNLLIHAQEAAWIGREDAPVQARLIAEADDRRISESIWLLAEVRNSSDHEITVSGIFIHEFSIKLFHDGAELKYTGPWKSMPPPSPVILPPGRIMRAVLGLGPGQYPELKETGVFTVEWAYYSGPNAQGITWTGALPTVKTSWLQK